MAIKSGFDPSSSSLFTDLNQLQKLKGQAQSDQQAALKGVAQEFEQLFMNMMLKSMRQANDVLATDSPFNSSDVKFYQEMFDQQLTLDLSKKDSIGLADIIVKQLSQKLDAVPRADTDDDEQQDRSFTEQMLNRAVASGPVNQPAGMPYSAPVANISAGQEDEALDEMAATGSSSDESGDALPARFETPAQFIEQLMPLAEKAAAMLGVNPSVLLAQAALETGWGKFITRDAGSGQSSRNLFNIKADSRWQGDTVQVQTLEYRGGVPEKEQARFRAYDSYANSFNDYVDFLRTNPRYQQALENGADPTRFVRELHNAGYATDPEYATKIERIFNGELLAGLGHGAQEG
ncbi:flagellar assembly peptidoglycan hydrolase FlgJ [Marinobacterium sediminicola]|uniref:Peptidoglycan hydrolase FlgJ n=1 Tax=Marinobacterium sediminicola TaxID=518898 RepID=A0ABY1RYQ7_9GAMM|nr:flagellar assembly peptidoglycan hydrolase FlgJ [Marinobacterium sediminicola]ULG68794.1 flagellar assembly peptidoglycan hydrolase FlgJ [Marinobacterium sediminicola]SMR73324.1 flagellar protein FlgJ [Marinobacterium sediminicola]